MIRILTFYALTPIPTPTIEAEALRARLLGLDVRGTVHVTPEGLNGTLSLAAHLLDDVRSALLAAVPDAPPGLLRAQSVPATAHVFGRLRIRLKREVVSLGLPGIGTGSAVGTHIPPTAWNAVLDDKDTILIDARNRYEVAAGTFPGAINPDTARFRDFPGWFRGFRAQLSAPRIAMFCTGGIRCEKASALLLALGERDVVQLEGGILAYLAAVPPEESRWHGQCFVFDERGAVD